MIIINYYEKDILLMIIISFISCEKEENASI